MTHTPYLPEGLRYVDGRLAFSGVLLEEAARAFGTPLYAYSADILLKNLAAYTDALGQKGMACFAVKANASLALLTLLAEKGAGFDVVSVGELEAVLKAGGDPAKCLFSGVGKTARELARAIELRVKSINIESEEEALRIAEIAGSLGVPANVSVRVNPDVDAKTHPKISTGLKTNKFGVAPERALRVYETLARCPTVRIAGVDCHIGSQITEIAPFEQAARSVLGLVGELQTRDIAVSHVDFGGGLGVDYTGRDAPPSPRELVGRLLTLVEEAGLADKEIILEPGRSLSALAGVLVAGVEYVKNGPGKLFVVTDAAMNDMARVALYDADMPVLPLIQKEGQAVACDVVGPICESTDTFKKNLPMVDPRPGEGLVIACAGAYGFSMASNYNMRAKPAEVLIEGGRLRLIRKRQSLDALFADEVLP